MSFNSILFLEIEKIKLNRVIESELDEEQEQNFNSNIDSLSQFSSLGYANKEELQKYFDLKIKLVDFKYKINLVNFLIKNFLNILNFENNENNKETYTSFFNSLYSLILEKSSVIVK